MNSSFKGKGRSYSGTIAIEKKSRIENWAQFQTLQGKVGICSQKADDGWKIAKTVDNSC